MKILHITSYCHAESVGGTERYILDLIHGLNANGIQNAIGWLASNRASGILESGGVRVIILPSPTMRVDSPLPHFHEAAQQLLDGEKPDLLHFHTFGLAEAELAKLAKASGIPRIFTYHSPAWTCRRETMLLYGQKPCDGEVRAWRCSGCQSAERLGGGMVASQLAVAASAAIGWAALPLGATSLRRRTAFFYDTLRFRSALREFLTQCDLVISCCEWSGPVLIKNGARPSKLQYHPQGVSTDFVSVIKMLSSKAIRNGKQNFTVGCVGRLSPVKGVHILVNGFLKTQQSDMRLRIVGWEPENSGSPYASAIKKLADADARIALVPKTTLAATAQEYDQLSLLAVPSVSMETGPLTLLEAAAAGVPIYGSARIGQMTLLQDRGRVVDPNTPESWRDALMDAFQRHQRGLWQEEVKRALGNGTIRTMVTVACEMTQSYQKLLCRA